MSRSLPWIVIVAVLASAPRVHAEPARWTTGVALGDDRSGDLRPGAAALLDAIAGEPGGYTVDQARAAGLAPTLPPGAIALATPTTIRVWRRALDGSTASCSGRVDVIPFDRYVKGVLPHEWIRSWNPQSLRAGAVAIRTYAAAWVASGGKYTCADLDDTTASQVYRDEFFPESDAAVDATAGVFVVKNNALVFAEYSAENGDPTATGVSEPVCTGHAVNGHGRGTCQWGTQRWALAGKTWDWMMTHYYPGASLVGGTPAYAATLGAEHHDLTLESGQEMVVFVEYQNDGTATWTHDDAFIGTGAPRDRESAFFKVENWSSSTRPTAVDQTAVAPGAVGRFSWVMKAPEVDAETVYSESFALVSGDGTWFGPADDAVTWTITVVPRGTGNPQTPDMPSDPSDPGGPGPQDPGGDAATGGCTSGGGGGAGALVVIIAVAAFLRRRRGVTGALRGVARSSIAALDSVAWTRRHCSGGRESARAPYQRRDPSALPTVSREAIDRLSANARSPERRRVGSWPMCLCSVITCALFVPGCKRGDDGAAARRGPSVGGDSELVAIFGDVARESGVPAEILAATAYVETRLAMVVPSDDGHGHGPATWGLFALSDDAGPGRDLATAAALAGVPIELARVDARANTRAAAALLADHAARSGRRPRSLADWRDALAAFGGGGAVGGDFADGVLTRIARGVAGGDDAGRRLVISARADAWPHTTGVVEQALGYPGALWRPASTSNYQAAGRGAAQINYIVIHTVQGNYDGCVGWFQNPAAQVSAHYVVRSIDGERTQMVDDSDVAWHDACFNSESIGIEHEGYVDDADRWYTEAMYMRSAELTSWLADQYGIAKDHAHIMGHGETPDCSDHTDPGPGWDWNHYLDLVRTGGAPQLAATYLTTDYPHDLVSGDEGVAWVEYRNDSSITWGIDETRLGTQDPQDRESPFFVDGNWLAPNRPTGADHSGYGPGASGRFTFAIRAPEVTEPTTFHETFQLVQEGIAWFGPTMTMDITVSPRDGGGSGSGGDPQPDPDGGGAAAGGCATGGSSGGGALALVCAILLGRGWSRRRRSAAP